MEILVDNEPLTDPAQCAGTVADLLERLRADDPDRLVVQLLLDGREVAADDLDRVRRVRLDGAGRLEVKTASARHLAADTLGQAADALSRARGQYEAIADALAAGKSPEAMERLGECLGTWGAAEQALRHALRVARLSPVAADGGAEDPDRLIADFQALLGRVQGALKIRDYVAVGDLVAYEMPEITDQWHDLLVGLQDRLAADG